MTAEGIIDEIFPIHTTKNGNQQMRVTITEEYGDYPQEAVFTAWAGLIEPIQKAGIGAVIKIYFKLAIWRTFNGTPVQQLNVYKVKIKNRTYSPYKEPKDAKPKKKVATYKEVVHEIIRDDKNYRSIF